MTMTGRDLIIYILSNGLENEPLYEDGHILGFMTAIEAAIKFDVGVSTVETWVKNKQLDGVKIGNELYIPQYAKNPMERKTDEKAITSTNSDFICNIDDDLCRRAFEAARLSATTSYRRSLQ